MVKYRIYSSYGTLHIVGTVNTMDDVINKIDGIVYKEDAHYLVIQQDFDNNMDTPVLSVWGVEEFEQFKKEYYENQKVKKLKY